MNTTEGIPLIKEALHALRGDPYFADAGIDAAFIEQLSRNMWNYELLPESTQRKAAEFFFEIAMEKSYRTTVGRKWNEDKSKMMADWLKGLNVLLAMRRTING
ncbi:hypothetical protein [Pseudoxanthomonas winnipegensis]|uniref:hypothetical protein n=1 Tax=Pseudoxanthomonas winnipegensis TaxID=2480810 RepID=UPI00103C91F5|nr:hypothetical protein [Pseudoxanthomonas winnipegensis]TBV69738.1 hypothetical protein EYC45_19000 [Pseudoxanthomonas winnipegensis]